MAATEQLLITESHKSWSHQICWCWPIKRVSVAIRSRAAGDASARDLLYWARAKCARDSFQDTQLLFPLHQQPLERENSLLLPKEAGKSDAAQLLGWHRNISQNQVSELVESLGPSTRSPGGFGQHWENWEGDAIPVRKVCEGRVTNFRVGEGSECGKGYSFAREFKKEVAVKG